MSSPNKGYFVHVLLRIGQTAASGWVLSIRKIIQGKQVNLPHLYVMVLVCLPSQTISWKFKDTGGCWPSSHMLYSHFYTKKPFLVGNVRTWTWDFLPSSHTFSSLCYHYWFSNMISQEQVQKDCAEKPSWFHSRKIHFSGAKGLWSNNCCIFETALLLSFSSMKLSYGKACQKKQL